MSGDIQSLQHRIDGAADLQGVVRAMKALAASSIGQYEKAVASLNDYYRTVELGLSVCLRQAGPAEKVKSGQPIGAVVFGSDQGLVGRFNEVVVDLARDSQEASWTRTETLGGGRACRIAFDGRGNGASRFVSGSGFNWGITPLVGRILIAIESAREKGEVVNVHVFHNLPKSGAVYAPVHRRLLPLDSVWQSRVAKIAWPGKSRPEVIGGFAAALKGLYADTCSCCCFRHARNR
jgi:F-type H+-transporting ATPase subunit gamma